MVHPLAGAGALRVSKLIKTRSDLLNFVLETRYVKEVFERELPKPALDKEKEERLRIRLMNEP
ncbi:MAG: hypothetical protein E6K18_07745 [Methanobacteriota archaeon]|nr:MAG: hypothetical protein E6K18_07745 [Euryarchaeota archaeon]